ncbi:MAG: hypothetical protein IKW82_08825, partial [Bacteroidales bacterium]|nr:hypothetical protein [Bacteroidales bacterium]
CLAFCFSLNLGFRLDVLLCLPFIERFLSLTPLTRRLVLCWPQTVKELRKHSLTKPFFLCLRAAKVRPFLKLASTFFKYFSYLIQFSDYQYEKFSRTKVWEWIGHLIIYNTRPI